MRVTNLDGTVVEVESNDAVVAHCVSAEGVYLGLIAPPSAATVVDTGPPDSRSGWRWDGAWGYVQSLDEARIEAMGAIDAAAGMARLRYITDVPGQAATYAEKRSQADTFVADPGGAVPSFVQAEADAMGVTPLQAAQYILATADAWAQIGPSIERERRRGKIEVAAATTQPACDAALLAALTALGGL